MVNSIDLKKTKQIFIKGICDGLPICFGYFAVAFSLGIIAKKAGFSPLQGFLASFFNNASAGEYAGFTLVAASATYVEVAVMTLFTNARYLLMSTALSQKFSESTSLWHRFLVAFDITDEIFAISIKQEGFLNPYYAYGAFSVALPGWALGTMFGIIAGDIMPTRVVSAFSVALYGMFLSCTIPKARESKVIGGVVIICFVLSYLISKLCVFEFLSTGTKTILLTIIIASVVAIVFPHEEE